MRLGSQSVQPYDDARDLIKYADAAGRLVLRVQAGSAAVFWPEDAHLPSLAQANRTARPQDRDQSAV